MLPTLFFILILTAVGAAISQPLTPDKAEKNNSSATSSAKGDGCSCETKSGGGDAITIIDYIFGGDDGQNGDEYTDNFGYGDLQLQNSVNSGSVIDEDDQQELSYKRNRKNKKTNKSGYDLRPRPQKKHKKNRKNSGHGRLTISHKGHKRIKSEQPCLPEKLSTCLNLNVSILASGNHLSCDQEHDFCVDDCDCPGFQKCCINSCGRRECLPSFKLADTTSTAAPVIAEETGSAVKPVDSTYPIEKKPEKETLVIDPAGQTPSVALPDLVPKPVPTLAPVVHAY